VKVGVGVCHSKKEKSCIFTTSLSTELLLLLKEQSPITRRPETSPAHRWGFGGEKAQKKKKKGGDIREGTRTLTWERSGGMTVCAEGRAIDYRSRI